MTYNPFQKPTNNSIFGNNESNNLFGNPTSSNNPNTNTIFGASNQNNQNPPNSIFGNNNGTLFKSGNNNPLFGGNNGNQGNNIIGNNNNAPFLAGINNNNPQNNQNNNNLLYNNNPQNNNIIQNQLLNLNNPKVQHDLIEYQEALYNVQKCFEPFERENMFKDYLYSPIPKDGSPNEYNVYRPYTNVNNVGKIMNDYNIWEEGNKNNKNPNEFYTSQISSVDSLLDRNKKLEKYILFNIAKTIDNEKNLEMLNKKIDDEMNNKMLELKNFHLKVDELEIDLSSKIAQYNYLIGAAKENVANTQEIKDNIKKVNDTIKKSNMMELCEKIKKSSNENFNGENKNYIKDMSKEKINGMLDSLVEIQNMMKIIYNNTKKNLDTIKGMQKEADKIFN